MLGECPSSAMPAGHRAAGLARRQLSLQLLSCCRASCRAPRPQPPWYALLGLHAAWLTAADVLLARDLFVNHTADGDRAV
jgi:hypothetical protein